LKEVARLAPPLFLFTESNRSHEVDQKIQTKSGKNNERPDHEGLGRPGSPPPELLAAQSKRMVFI
jgi:hypothetical protein